MRIYHSILLFFLLFPCFWIPSEEVFSGPSWVRVMTDRGDSGSRWFMVSSPGRQAVKRLHLDFPVSGLAGVALEYQIQTEPYDPKLKQHISSDKYLWADFLVKVNEQVLIDAPASQYIRKGSHQIPIPVEVLQQGENVISMSWKKIAEGNPTKQCYGYIYFTQDLDDNMVTPNLRIRLLLQFKNYCGTCSFP